LCSARLNQSALLKGRAMNRATLREQLAEVKRHIADGYKNLARQRAELSKLSRDGDREGAERGVRLLMQMEETQALHLADRDRLVKERVGGN